MFYNTNKKQLFVDLLFIFTQNFKLKKMKPIKINLVSELEAMYLDWVNNWASLRKFADHYGYTENEADLIIDAGRKIYNNKFI